MPCDFWQWVLWNHGRFWTPDGTRCIVNSPEALEALQFLHDLQYRYRVCPTFSQHARLQRGSDLRQRRHGDV